MTSSSVISKNPLVRFAIGALPSRMKRIVFLASLTAIAKQSNVPEEVLIHKLNQVLQLSSTGDAALKLPFHVSQLIWTGATVFKEDIDHLTECQGFEATAQKSAEKIVSSVPEWFRYDTPLALVKDILAVFSSASCIFPAAKA